MTGTSHAAGKENSLLEDDIIRAISAARVDPAGMRARISARLQFFKGKDFYPPDRGGNVAVPSKEGKAAIEDAVAFLAHQPPLAPLMAPPEPSGLKLAAEDHLVDRGTLGRVGHGGEDGSSSSERQARYGQWSGKSGECLWFGRAEASAETIVADLVIDDGVPSRGHRSFMTWNLLVSASSFHACRVCGFSGVHVQIVLLCPLLATEFHTSGNHSKPYDCLFRGARYHACIINREQPHAVGVVDRLHEDRLHLEWCTPVEQLVELPFYLAEFSVHLDHSPVHIRLWVFTD